MFIYICSFDFKWKVVFGVSIVKKCGFVICCLNKDM